MPFLFGLEYARDSVKYAPLLVVPVFNWYIGQYDADDSGFACYKHSVAKVHFLSFVCYPFYALNIFYFCNLFMKHSIFLATK